MSSTPSLPSFSALYAFGDSLSDAGNLSIALSLTGTVEPVSPPYYQEQYSSGQGNVFSNGPTWVQDLSLALNLGTLEPSLLGGHDFAYGGAVTGGTPQDPPGSQIQSISLPIQLATFKLDYSHPPANALYTLSIGSNDLLSILEDPSLSSSQQTFDVTAAVTNELDFISALAAVGGTNFVVMNVPDLGKTPEVLSGAADGSNSPSAALDTLATSLSSEYDSLLASGLASVASADSLDVHTVDAFRLIDNAVASPSAYGLGNVTTPVWSGDFTSSVSGTLVSTVTATQNQYLFWDQLHPTETGHQQLALLAEAALTGTAPCFAEGTRIASARGDVPVEALRVGDVTRLAEGGFARVGWLGHRRVDCRRHPRPQDVQPVRIAAHAFGLGRPQRDLRLSPDHAVFVDGVLIPVRYLLNAATIEQEDIDAVTYWHVELPAHGVLLAEGLPAESYLDTGNRCAFANGGSLVQAHAEFALAVWDSCACAPLVTHGPAVDTIARRLLAQALGLGYRPRDAGSGRTRWIAPERRQVA